MSASSKPGKDEFARVMMDAIREAEPGTELEYDAAEFRLRLDGATRYYFHLGNGYQEYCNARGAADRKKVVDRYLKAWAARLDTEATPAADVSDSLRPAVRLRSYFELTRLRFQERLDSPPAAFPYRVLGEHYALGLMRLEGNTLQVVGQHHLDEWGMEFEAALDIAVDNLRQHSDKPFRQNADGVWFGMWGDDFGPSRLLFTDRIRQECPVPGEPVVLLAERRVLLITGSQDEAGLHAAALLAEDLGKDGRPVGALPLRLRGEQWEPFLPPVGTPAGKTLRLMWWESQAGDYQSQAKFLSALHQKAGSGVALSPYHVYPGKDSQTPFSFTVWIEGVDALLPRAEEILFAVQDPAGGEPTVRAQVGWDAAVGLVGDLMERQEGLYPERWRVRSFPDPKRLAALRAASGS